MTALIASVMVPPDGELPKTDHLAACGADMVEWRVDLLAGTEDGSTRLASLLDASTLPAIVTVRSIGEGGLFDGDDQARANLYAAALASNAPPRYIDIEHDAHEGPLADLDLGETGVILSWHGPGGRPADLLQRFEAMQGVESAAVIKIAWTARSIRDNLEAFELLRLAQRPTIALCMGRFGFMSRVLAPKFGGFATFASLGEATAPGQPVLDDLLDRFAMGRIGQDTVVHGLIGDPVEHSPGHAWHNTTFADAGHDAIYLPMPVPAGWEHFKATMCALSDDQHLDFRGASVTIPHKEHLLRWVREEGGSVDAVCDRVGVANTLSIQNGAMACFNTDVPGSAVAMKGYLQGTSVLVLGAGGAARAVAAAAMDGGASVSIVARRAERVAELAKDLGCNIAVDGDGADLVVNCTPLGMIGGPDPEGDPLAMLAPWIEIAPPLVVFDTVMAPARTPLLQRAEAGGCTTITGWAMFEGQAKLQQEAWAS